MIDIEDIDYEVIWEPLPDFEGHASSQSLAVVCDCNEVLYDGSRGPGKTDTQLMRFRSLVGLGYGKHLRGVILDREYKGLDDMVAKSEKHFFAFNDGAKFKKSKGDYKWTWPSGEELLFRVIKRESDYLKFHGQEFAFIAWNELTKYPNRKIYDLMKSTNRSGFLPVKHTPTSKVTGKYLTEDEQPLPPIPLQIFATTNPWGPGHSWVKEQFIDGADPGEIIYKTTNVFNPRTKKRENVTTTQTRIFGTYKENIYLDAAYIAGLENETDPERRKAWLLGDWNIRAGGMFNDIWKESVHIVENFNVPANWRIDRCFDWGSSKPFSVGWFAEANGESVKMPNGTYWTPARGSIIRIDEWYGTTGSVNDGLRLSTPDIAGGILEREMTMLTSGMIKTIPAAGVADPSIFSATLGVDVETLANKYEAEGVDWLCVRFGKDSRKNGWQIMRDAMRNSITKEGPGLYVTKRCKHAIKFIPDTPRDEENPDDVDTDCEDHLQDEFRYKMLDASNKWSGKIKTKFAKSNQSR